MRRMMVGACALLVTASVARAGTIYTNKAAWEAALAGQTINSLTLTPQDVPKAGATIADDEVTLVFEPDVWARHIYAEGWYGDVSRSYLPTMDRATFAQPVQAFSAVVKVGYDTFDPTLDAISLGLDSSYKITRAEAGFSNARFWGWIGQPVSELTIVSAGYNHFYELREIQYVTYPTAGIPPVPVPAAIFAGLPLLLGIIAHRVRARAAVVTRA